MTALLTLLHPVPSLATVAVALGFAALLWHGWPPLDRLAWLGLMLALQQFSISLHNDWCDRELDRIAKPWRAIPSGTVPAAAVRAAAWAGAGTSLLAALPLGLLTMALDAAGLAAGFAYNAGLKRTSVSWLPFAAAFPLLPLFGAAALDRWPPAWWSLFAVGLPVVLAIHLADSLPDLESDRAAGARSLGIRLGRRRARQLSLGALAAACLLGAGGAVLGGGWWTGAGALAGLACLGVVLLRRSLHRPLVTAGAAAVALGWVAGLAAQVQP